MHRRNAVKGIIAIGFGVLTGFLNFLTSKSKQNKTIHFVGLGGAGSNVLKHIHKKGIKAKYTCIDELGRAKLPTDVNFLKFEYHKGHTMNDNEEFQSFSKVNQAKELPNDIKAIFEADECYILLAGLGGMTGSYLSEELTIWLKTQNIDFMTIVCLPFAFEGEKRNANANRIVTKFQSFSNFKYCRLDLIERKYGGMSFNKGIDMANEQFYTLFKNNSI